MFHDVYSLSEGDLYSRLLRVRMARMCLSRACSPRERPAVCPSTALIVSAPTRC